jgi:hypothetical protein
MIRHVFLGWGGLAGRGRGRGRLVRALCQAAAIGTLPIPMIEAPRQTALMTLPRPAPLLRPGLRAASGAAITLPAITRAAHKEARPARGGATKALAERLRP